MVCQTCIAIKAAKALYVIYFRICNTELISYCNISESSFSLAEEFKLKKCISIKEMLSLFSLWESFMVRSSRSCSTFIADISFPSKNHLTFAPSWRHHSSWHSAYQTIWGEQRHNKLEEKLISSDVKKFHQKLYLDFLYFKRLSYPFHSHWLCFVL